VRPLQERARLGERGQRQHLERIVTREHPDITTLRRSDKSGGDHLNAFGCLHLIEAGRDDNLRDLQKEYALLRLYELCQRGECWRCLVACRREQIDVSHISSSQRISFGQSGMVRRQTRPDGPVKRVHEFPRPTASASSKAVSATSKGWAGPLQALAGEPLLVPLLRRGCWIRFGRGAVS
jgi:hypothetical protein